MCNSINCTEMGSGLAVSPLFAKLMKYIHDVLSKKKVHILL